MNKYVISFFLIVVLINGTYSQSHFADIGSVWYNTIRDPENGNPFYGYTKYESLKDTLINSMSCKFIRSSENEKLLIREQDDKVYWITDGQSKLLFDFSVSEEDTVYFDLQAYTFLLDSNENFTFIDTIIKVLSIVEKIDSLQVDGEYLKQVTVQIFPEGDFLINAVWPSGFTYCEKLGCLEDGMIPLLIRGMGPDIPVNRFLRCYNGAGLNYINPYYEDFNVPCDYQVKTDNHLIKEVANVLIFPNPVNEFIAINTGQYLDAFRMEIFDFTGKCVCRKEMLNSPEIYFSVDFLQTGYYCIRLYSLEGILIEQTKFIKL